MNQEEKTGGLVRLKVFAMPYKREYMISVLLAITGVAGSMVPYFCVSKIIVGLIQRENQISYYLLWGMIAAAGFFIKVLFHNLSTMISHKATFAVISNIRHLIVAKLTKVPMGYILDIPSGKMKNILVEKVDSIEPALAHVLPEMTSNFLIPAAIIIYLFCLDYRMALISLITLPVGVLCMSMMMRGYETKYKKYQDVAKHMNATAVEYINGIEVIKAFGQSAASYGKFAQAIKENANYGLNWMRQSQVYFAMGMGILPAVLIGVLPVGCIFYMNGTLSEVTFITITILALGITGPIIAALYYMDDIAKIGAIMDDIGAVLDEPEQIRPDKRAAVADAGITLEEVTFGYKEKEILHGINLSIASGTVTALVGPSGSGKSTIAKLIASFWDITTGKISLGGVDVKEIPTNQLMEHIAYVSQDNYLFDETILENLRMGKPSASDEEVIAAATAAGCHNFIMNLENGYQTMAGGAGGHLSGGERQRISIARAMLKDSSVVILDEATAYTDPENEAVIQAAVAKLVKGRTLIVIAHRLSTITDSDQIVVVEDGHIKATGKHEELLADCSLYRKMWEEHISAKDAV